MRDRHFMEDENEWPYLVSEDSHVYTGSGKSGSVPLKADFESLPFSEFSSRISRLVIDSRNKAKILSSIAVEPANCRFSLHYDGSKIRISLILENEFLTSNFNGFYDLDTSEMTFYQPIHSYNRLESMPWLEREIKRVESEIGLGFYGFGGGYQYSWFNGYLTINDEIEVHVFFTSGDSLSDYHSYRVDFKGKRLVKYHVHPWFEFFDSVF